MTGSKAPAIFAVLAVAIHTLSPALADQVNDFKPFAPSEYNTNDFKVSTKKIEFGNVLVEMTQVKRISKDRTKEPHLCRAWLQVFSGQKPLLQRYFADIDAVGYSYGLFFPTARLPESYLAIVKNGDYDGRLFLIHKDGKVFDLLGGRFFLSKDNRYLFSLFVTDGTGLEVFDLKHQKSIFSSKATSEHEWYELEGKYFFTEDEEQDRAGWPKEKTGSAQFFNIKMGKLEKRQLSKRDLSRSKKITNIYTADDSKSCVFSN